jgi:hypothetical protein
MSYILIVIVYWATPAITTIEFSRLDLCEEAKVEVMKKRKNIEAVDAMCVKRS